MRFFKVDEEGNAQEKPISIDSLRKRITNVSIPAEPSYSFLKEYGYGFVLDNDSDVPYCNAGETLEIGFPIKVEEGKWRNDFKVVPMPFREAEYRIRELRAKRDKLLQLSDFTQLKDYQDIISDLAKEEWKKYRQALRDLPQATKNLKDIKWPVQPFQI